MKKNDIVKHKLDGRMMIVLQICSRGYIRCEYWTGEKYDRDLFSIDVLENIC